MVIERPISDLHPWDGSQRIRLSRDTFITIGLVAALHVAGGLYLYQMRVATPKVVEPTDGVPIRSYRLPPPPSELPESKPQPIKAVRVHDPVPSPSRPPTTLDATPQPPKADLAISGPPILATERIPQPDVGGLTTSPPGPRVIHDPNWLVRPTNAQLVEFYPPRALDDGIAGQATLDCTVTASGQLIHCTVSGETPKGQGFGEAALKAARIFRMKPRTEDGQPVEGGTVHVPMRFAVQ